MSRVKVPYKSKTILFYVTTYMDAVGVALAALSVDAEVADSVPLTVAPVGAAMFITVAGSMPDELGQAVVVPLVEQDVIGSVEFEFDGATGSASSYSMAAASG